MKISRIDVPEFVMSICRRLTNAGYRAVVVGGAVCDSLNGEKPHDWDLATSATPDEVRAVFTHEVRSNNGEDRGTVLILSDGVPVEVTTFRLDVETDGRNAAVRFTRDLLEDLVRRDLTVNAMAYDAVTGELFGPGLNGDPSGAMEDLRNKCVRFVGDGLTRIVEDRLHVPRAIRRMVKLDGYLHPTAAYAIERAISMGLLPGPLSAERIRDELMKLLALTGAEKGMRLWKRFGLLKMFLPEVTALDGLTQNVHHIDDALEHTIKALGFVRAGHTPYPGLESLVLHLDLTPAQAARSALGLAMLLHDTGKLETREYHEGYGNSFLRHELVSAEIARRVCSRLKMDNGLSDLVVAGAKFHMHIPGEDSSPKSVRRWARGVGGCTGFVMDMRLADRASLGIDLARAALADNAYVDNILAETPVEVRLPISGDDVMSVLGLKPGPQVGEIMRKLFEMADENPGMSRDDMLSALGGLSA